MFKTLVLLAKLCYAKAIGRKLLFELNLLYSESASLKERDQRTVQYQEHKTNAIHRHHRPVFQTRHVCHSKYIPTRLQEDEKKIHLQDRYV